MVAKKKGKQKPKQINKQKQSQNVIVNINQTKKKPSRKKYIKQQKSINSSVIYSMPDNRALDSLRGDLVDTNNKLLNIQKSQNLVNNNNVSETKYYSRDDNIGDWKDIKLFKDESKKEEEKQKRQNFNKDILSHSKIFQLQKEKKEEKKANFNKDISTQAKIFQLKGDIKKEKKEKINQVKENLNNVVTINGLTKQIEDDRKQFNKFIEDVEDDFKAQHEKSRKALEKARLAEDRYGMRDNDIDVKTRFSEMNPNEVAKYHIEKAQIRKIKKRIADQKPADEPNQMFQLFAPNEEKANKKIDDFM